jgi:hypothetical protein
VFGIFGGLTFGLSPAPSAEGTLFLGGRLKNKRWAVGYMGTLSLGRADRYSLGTATTRHYIAALHHFKDRGFASVGAGLGIHLFTPALVEAEGRIGARFGKQRRFVLGGLVRLGYNFFYEEKAPVPQFGGFLGLSLL